METASYDIRFDEQRGLLNLTLRGFWSLETLDAFRTELVEVAARVREQRPSFPVLSDSIAFAVQSVEVADRLGELMLAGAQVNSGRVAIVVGSILNKKQAERALQAPNLRVFVDKEEALEWLMQ
ncbi:hypothetical protein [Sphingosinithalassobacter sp. CS137]|uniref:hypothetical protein n=1 Tax=Sphingosinithalassobacter sp. CS137 TaxID=2762748 RepID=UPI00165DFFAE|nr:hypothetical protein [Sphingosinithalassobacter sp. CS137]